MKHILELYHNNSVEVEFIPICKIIKVDIREEMTYKWLLRVKTTGEQIVKGFFNYNECLSEYKKIMKKIEKYYETYGTPQNK